MSALPIALTMKIQEQLVIKANLYDSYGSQATSTITWSSSDSTIATVQRTVDLANGALITTHANTGSCTITATADTQTATFALTVITGAVGLTDTIDLSADESLQPRKKMQY